MTPTNRRIFLAAAGATVDGALVRIPSGLVGEMLNTVPPRIALGNRDGDRTVLLESHRIYYGTGSDCPFIIDAETGERVAHFAELVSENRRKSDVVARVGGEEFALLLPNTEPAGAMHLAERINWRLPTLPVGSPTATWRLTASFGIAELTPELNKLPVTDALGLLYARADKAMYECKTSGRARAEVYRPDMGLE